MNFKMYKTLSVLYTFTLVKKAFRTRGLPVVQLRSRAHAPGAAQSSWRPAHEAKTQGLRTTPLLDLKSFKHFKVVLKLFKATYYLSLLLNILNRNYFKGKMDLRS